MQETEAETLERRIREIDEEIRSIEASDIDIPDCILMSHKIERDTFQKRLDELK